MENNQPTKQALINALGNKDKNAKYFVDQDGQSLIVIGNVDISGRQLEKLPVKFAVVTGAFDCSDNSLTTLKNCPKVIGGDLNCDNNKLTNLKIHPAAVGGKFSCNNNHKLNAWLKRQLVNIEDKKIDWDFVCVSVNINSSKKLRIASEKTGIFDID